MLITSDVDFGLADDEMVTPEALMLNLGKEIRFALPNGEYATGVLADVSMFDEGRLGRITLDIDDRYELLYLTATDHRGEPIGGSVF